MEVNFSYQVKENGKLILGGNGNSDIDTIMISNIKNKCSEYGISFTDFMEEVINRLTMDEVEEILLSMAM